MLSSVARAAMLGRGAAEYAVRPAIAFSTRLYHKNIVDHYESPRNVGSMDKSDPAVGTGLVGAPACGDVMKLQIRVGQDGVVEEAVFKTFGCGSAIASSSYATEWLKGKTLEEAGKIENKGSRKQTIYCQNTASDPEHDLSPLLQGKGLT